MKFQQLRSAIEKAFQNRDINEFTAPSSKPKTEPPKYFLKSKPEHLRVVKGVIIYQPVDKTARMVVQPAPWWSKPNLTNEKQHIGTRGSHPSKPENAPKKCASVESHRHDKNAQKNCQTPKKNTFGQSIPQNKPRQAPDESTVMRWLTEGKINAEVAMELLGE